MNRVEDKQSPPTALGWRSVVWSGILAMVLLSGLGGCVSQEQVSREIRSERQSRYERMQNPQVAAEAEAEWTVVEGELDLAGCVELALRYNKDVQKGKARLLEGRGQMTEAISTAMPKASFTGTGLWNDNSGFGDQKETYDLQLLARQPLYLGGQMGAAIDAASVFVYEVQQGLRQSIQAVQFTVRQQYIDALLAGHLVDVAKKSKADAEKLLQDTEKKYQYGSATRFDVLQGQVRLNSVEADLIKRRNDQALSITRLLNTLGVSQQSQIQLSGELDYESIQIDHGRCLEIAMTNRPDLLIGQAMVRLLKDHVLSEEAGNRPRVYLQGSYGRSYPGFAASFKDLNFGGGDESDPASGGGGPSYGKQWERTMSVGVVVEWPLFDGLATQGRVTQAKSKVHQQQILLSRQEEQTQLEIRQSLLRMQNSEEYVLSQKGHVSNAEEALRLAQVGFREGTITNLEIISSELALEEARSNYYQAVHAYKTAQLELSRALGTLGEEEIPLEVIEEPRQTDSAGQAEEESGL